MHGLARLANLMVGGQPAGVNRGAGTAHNAAKLRSQLFRQLDASLDVLADAAANGHDEVRADQIHQLLRRLHDLHNLGFHVRLGKLERGLHNLAGIRLGLIEGSRLHHAGPHRRHGGTETGADNGCHQMSAERRTGHLQVAGHVVLLAQHHGGAHAIDLLGGQSGGLTQEVLVVVHLHVQVRAVRAQAGVQTRGAAGAEVTADVGRAEQHDLRLVLLDHLADGGGVAVGGVVLQQGMVTDIDLVRAVAAQLLRQALHAVAQKQAAQLNAQLVRQSPALGNQLEIGGHQLALALLAEHPYILESSDIRVVKRHVQLPLSQMMCLADRIPTSFSQASLSAPSSIMPAPFSGGVKEVRMLVGEPFRPMVLGSIRASSFSVS
ncbi:hypothetical protein SDC9_109927 [bioreactor metagenome]|uniref:Uncharacterized protein n=1 Tax=bioreactor metagenome TaxID=1076179 RepID=A0A645BC43_9ZZZZ